MSQESLDFGPRVRVVRDAERLRTVIRRVADVIGVKELAYAADVSPSYVVQALNGTKSLKDEIIIAARELAPEELAMEMRRIFVGDGYHVSGERPLTAEQLQALDVVRREFGESGERRLMERFRNG